MPFLKLTIGGARKGIFGEIRHGIAAVFVRRAMARLYKLFLDYCLKNCIFAPIITIPFHHANSENDDRRRSGENGTVR